jgi:hypothetical protein
LLAYPGHVICTLRVKTDWVEGENSRGRRQMMKVGTKAEQREGLEYEFDLVASMDLSNELTVVKSRCPALSGAIVDHPGRDFAETFKAWLADGVDAAPTARSLLLEQIRSAADKDTLAEAWKAIGAALHGGGITKAEAEDLSASWKARNAQIAATEENSIVNRLEATQQVLLLEAAAAQLKRARQGRCGLATRRRRPKRVRGAGRGTDVADRRPRDVVAAGVEGGPVRRRPVRARRVGEGPVPVRDPRGGQPGVPVGAAGPALAGG